MSRWSTGPRGLIPVRKWRGEDITKLRRYLDVPQQEMAEAMGLSRASTLSKKEHEREAITKQDCMILTQILMHPDEFFRDVRDLTRVWADRTD